jgi:hypothetical protein
MDNQRKTKIVALRISPKLEQQVLEYAKKHKWSKSFAICEILNQHLSLTFK